jgi:hypothetical protein
MKIMATISTGSKLALVVFALMSLCSQAAVDVTITTAAGERQTFLGLGTSFNSGQTHFRDISDVTKAEVMSFVFDTAGLNTQYVRLWSGVWNCQGDLQNYCGRQLGYAYQPWVDWARKYNPDVKLFLALTGSKGASPAAYAAAYAEQILKLKTYYKDYGDGDGPIDVMATGIANEPDVHERFIAAEIPEYVKAFRTELDRRGLNHIKIIAPETSGSASSAWDMIAAINNDAQAYAALGAYSTHSYNLSINFVIEDMVKNGVLNDGKEYWMTEGSDFQIELWEDPEQAAGMTSRWLGDLNHLCNVWVFYMMVAGRDTYWANASGELMNGFHMILYRIEEQDVGILLKGYYFKDVSHTIEPGAIVRKSRTDITKYNDPKCNDDDDDNDPAICYGRLDEDMAFWYGRKAPLYLASAVNPDGSWGMAVTNYSGNVEPDAYGSLVPATSFRLTVVNEELAGIDSIAFRAHRCNATYPYIHEEDTVYMVNGTMIIDSLGSFDLMTFRSGPGISSTRKNTRPIAARASGAALKVSGNCRGCKSVTVEFQIEQQAGRIATPVRLSLYDMKGREVSVLFNEAMPAGVHTLSMTYETFAAKGLAAGLYLLRYACDSEHTTVPLILEY